MEIELRALSLDDGDDVYNFLQELGPGENGFWNPGFEIDQVDGFQNYLNHNHNCSLGIDLSENIVPQTIYWLVVDGEIVGLGKLRHRLNDKLKLEGGHIGYSIKQSARGKGYGTEILRLMLIEAKALGIEEALLTIGEVNEPSRRTTARNGGELRDVVNGKGYWWIRLKG